MSNPPQSSDRPPRLLILEDSATLVLQLSRSLRTEFPTLGILTARNVAEAQELVAEYPVDFFLLDIHLPDGTGIDFLCDIQTAQPAAKVILITAVPLPEYRERSRQLGVLEFMEKPLNFAAICDSVGRELGLREKPADAPVNFEASLSCLTPVDIIQLKCLSGATQTLEFVRSDAERGRIYFSGGEIVHAEVNGRRGVDAFNEMVGWRGGRVLEVAGAPLASPTIREHWQHLVMSAVQLLDEQALAS